MTAKFKILMFEKMHPQGTALLQDACDLRYAESLEEAHLIEQARDVDAMIIRANGAITAALIDAAPALKVIGRHGVGLDAIDLEAARRKGVRVVYTPQANKESVAEHFVALALMLAKKMRLADMALRETRWQARYELIGTELQGKTLGVLGFGRIGQQTARICHAGFGMPVLYYDTVSYPEAEAELQARRLEAPSVCAQADFISINMPLLPQTRHFVNADLIAAMKPTAFLVNMARGPVWQEADVVAALQAGALAGAGSDVYEIEPVSADNPLLAQPNFVGTPHMSAHTEEAMIRMSMVARDVLAVLTGQEPDYPYL